VRGPGALVSAACVAAWSAACGLTADYSGLQGGARASADGGEPVALDATSAASNESGGTTDASDANPSFCTTLTTPVKLCEDFDEGEAVDAGWSATDLYGGEAISLSTTALSPPSSFLSAINPSGAPSSARLLENVATLSPHVHVDVEMLLTPSDGTFELVVIHQVVANGTTYGLYYREVDSALQVELRTLGDDGSVFDQTWPIGAPPSGWTRVVLDMDVSDSGSFTVQQGGQLVASQSNLPTSTDSRTAMFVELGFYSFTPAAGQANFDNAIVDWQ
jgi:hypothetical protein